MLANRLKQAESTLEFLSSVEHQPFVIRQEESDTTLHEQLTRFQHVVLLSSRVSRGIQNSLIPINRLPIELPVLIFKFHQNAAIGVGTFPAYNNVFRPREPYYGSRRKTQPHCQFGVSHVCRHWRRVMLCNSTLWETIVLDGSVTPTPELLDCFLDRAGQGPLRIVVLFEGQDDYYMKKTFNFLSDNMERIKELRIHCSPWDILEITEPAPILECLDITCDTSWFFGSLDPEPPVLIPWLLERAPVLRRLAVENIYTLPLKVWSKLTHLCIGGPWDTQSPVYEWGGRPGAELQTYRDFLSVLEANPRLEQLFIKTPCYWINNSDELSSVTERIELRCLQRLFLGNITSRQVAQFLSNLILPKAVCMNIALIYCPGEEDHMFAFLPTIEPPTPIFAETTALELDFSASDYSGHLASGIGPFGSFGITASSTKSYDNTLHAFLCGLSFEGFQHVSELRIAGPHAQDLDQDMDFRLVLSELPLLVKLAINGDLPLILETLEVLTSHAEASDASSTPPSTSRPSITCPRLQTLWIKLSNDTKPPEVDQVLSDLLQCMRARFAVQDQKFPEILLRIFSANLYDRQIKGSIALLQEVVANVEAVCYLPPEGIDLPAWGKDSLQRTDANGSRDAWWKPFRLARSRYDDRGWNRVERPKIDYKKLAYAGFYSM
ncbi:hypothetical protein EIP91_003596 [Steccherinum ochraceum]|uniref:Uncharacterized protein n=1 Tax=Steccherinum ochraceum TaxID=92696 RepID=A0A4R0RGK6_9APHY|nr:hypothetical protein EIP91_003596 [Steccherinum ochraceum]